MMLLFGDIVTVQRNVGGELVEITGRIAGMIQNDTGDLERFHIKGLREGLWISDGWKFQDHDEYELEEDDEV